MLLCVSAPRRLRKVNRKNVLHVKSQGKVLIGAWIAKGGEEGGQRKRQRERERGRDRERIARAASLHARR